MKLRSLSGGVKLINSSYENLDSIELVLASESIVKETLAIKNKDDITLINDDNVKFYSVLGKKGLGSKKSSAMHGVLFALTGPLGTLGSTTVDLIAGGKRKRQVVFIKLKNSIRILVIIEDGYGHMLRSKNKIKKDDICDDDMKWIRNSLEEHPVYL